MNEEAGEPGPVASELVNNGAQRRRQAPRKFSSPSEHRGLEEQAVLRAARNGGFDTLTIDYSRPDIQIELRAGDIPLCTGQWRLRIVLPSGPVDLSTGWRCVCWNSDEDGDYLELQQVLDSGLRVERQVFFSRGSPFAICAVAIAEAPRPGLHFTTGLTFEAGTRVRHQPSGPGVWMSHGGIRARVIPLFVPETSGAALEAPEASRPGLAARGEVSWSADTDGTGAYAPLVMDWDKARQRCKAEWRSLTVTEEAAVLNSDVAAGYRLRVGKEQWLVYHAVTRSPSARAVLGHHTRDETVIARFTAAGEVVPLLRIE